MPLHKNHREDLFSKILFDDREFNALLKKSSFADATKILFDNQKNEWPQLKNGVSALRSVRYKELSFGNFSVKLQYNPDRIISTQAKTDIESIKKRECFLCYSNLPAQQKGILYEHEYLVICNPFPIFNEHFTLPNINHFKQAIKGNFGTLLNFSKDLSKYYSVFYNGPACGASAPDHLHFQAGDKNFLPVEQQFETLKKSFGETILDNANIKVTGIDDSLRRYISIESENDKLIINVFDILYELLQNITEPNGEPPVNMISSYEEDNGWRVIIFLRDKHRPSHFFAEGDSKIVFSPGVVDMGGICILPVEKDFNLVDAELLKEIFSEVVMGKEYFDYIKSSLIKRL